MVRLPVGGESWGEIMAGKFAIALVFAALALSACGPPGYHRAVVYYQHGDYAAAVSADPKQQGIRIWASITI